MLYLFSNFIVAALALAAAAASGRPVIRMMCDVPPPPITKVLISSRPGIFYFSDIFLTEFEKRYNERLNRADLLPCYTYDLRNSAHKRYRYDTRIIELFEKLGPIKSDYTPFNIVIKEIPTEVIPYMTIHERFGKEYIVVHLGEMYRELAKKIIDSRYIMHTDTLRYEHIENLRANLTASGYICL